MEIVFACLVCLAASTIGGICGVGGGVLIKPVLDSSGMMPVATLSFLSGVTVLTMACVNVLKNRKGHELDAKRSIPLGLGAAAGGVLGKYAFDRMRQGMGNQQTVGGIQAVLLGIMVLGTLLYVLNKTKIRTKNIQQPAAALSIGLALGIASSFLGIGGGPMNLAVLYYFFSMDTKKAAVNSILVILLSQTASLVFSLLSHTVPPFSWGMMAAMAGAGALGGFISSRLHKKISASTTDRLFTALLALIVCICIYNAVRMFGPAGI